MGIVKKEIASKKQEEMFTIGLIMSSDFIQKIQKVFKPKYIKSNYLRILAQWCFEYFNEIGKAPRENIKEVFENKQYKLHDNDVAILAELLYDLSEKFDTEPEENFNVDFLVLKTIEYFKIRSVEILANELKEKVNQDDYQGSEELIVSFTKLEKPVSGFEKDLSLKSFEEDLNEDKIVDLFKFPGAIGNILGGFRREWLVTFVGPPKRGKSRWIAETVYHALMNNLKAVLISMEMSHKEIRTNTITRFIGKIHPSNMPDDDLIKIAVFDCFANQTGKCKRKYRENRIAIRDSEIGYLLERVKFDKYKPCSFCKGNPEFNKLYEQGIYFEEFKIKKRGIDDKQTFKEVSKKFRNHYRSKAFPQKSINVKDIKHYIYMLNEEEGFIPDLIAVDYGDILGKEDNRLFGRDSSDATWSALKSLAGETKTLVISASQSNRASMDRTTIRPTDIAEDIRKIAHADAVIGLHQTNNEKILGLTRIGLLNHRHYYFDLNKLALVTQNQAINVCLNDSDFYRDYMEEKIEELAGRISNGIII